jgi:hypothetical protein
LHREATIEVVRGKENHQKLKKVSFPLFVPARHALNQQRKPDRHRNLRGQPNQQRSPRAAIGYGACLTNQAISKAPVSAGAFFRPSVRFLLS